MKQRERSRRVRGTQRCREEGGRRSAGDDNLFLLLRLRRPCSPSTERERERERAGMGEMSSGRWGEVDGGVNEASNQRHELGLDL
jgi:hypothetical protein